MALPHARPGEPIDIRPLAERLPQERTRALIKTRSLELIRTVLRAGESQPRHSVHGELTLQCIEGRVEVTADDLRCEVAAGHLLLLPAGCEHRLHALEDSSLLLTVQLPPGLPGSASSTSG